MEMVKRATSMTLTRQTESIYRRILISKNVNKNFVRFKLPHRTLFIVRNLVVDEEDKGLKIPHFLFLRRNFYNDSSALITAVRQLPTVSQILNFYCSNPDMNLTGLEATLRAISKLINSRDVPNVSPQDINFQDSQRNSLTFPGISGDIQSVSALVADERFGRLVASICSNLESADGRLLAMISNACGYFRIAVGPISTLLDTLCSCIVRRENGFSPRNLSTIALAFSVLSHKNPHLIEFIRVETIKAIADFSPPDLYTTLDAFRRWAVFSRELTDLLIEKMIDDVDKFTSKDVAETIHCLAQAGLARGFLLRRLSVLCFENLQQFTQRQLVILLFSLNKLRFLKIEEVNDILNVIRPNLHSLHYSQLSQLLFSLTLCDYLNNSKNDYSETLIREIIDIYADKGENFLQGKTLLSLTDFAYSLCFFQLFDDKSNAMLEIALSRIFNGNPIKNRYILNKLWEIVNCIELEKPACKINVPFDWKNAMEEADNLEQDKTESSRVHNEILILLDGLRGKYKINVQKNKNLKNYRVDFIDEESKIIIEIDLINKHTNKVMKHRHLNQMGYIPICIGYWLWRRCRSEEDQIVFLKNLLTPALVKVGKIDQETINIQE